MHLKKYSSTFTNTSEVCVCECDYCRQVSTRCPDLIRNKPHKTCSIILKVEQNMFIRETLTVSELFRTGKYVETCYLWSSHKHYRCTAGEIRLKSTGVPLQTKQKKLNNARLDRQVVWHKGLAQTGTCSTKIYMMQDHDVHLHLKEKSRKEKADEKKDVSLWEREISNGPFPGGREIFSRNYWNQTKYSHTISVHQCVNHDLTMQFTVTLALLNRHVAWRAGRGRVYDEPSISQEKRNLRRVYPNFLELKNMLLTNRSLTSWVKNLATSGLSERWFCADSPDRQRDGRRMCSASCVCGCNTVL